MPVSKPTTEKPVWFWCRRCGMVRKSDRAPWCRHGDIELPAQRMVPLPEWHPMACHEPGPDWPAT